MHVRENLREVRLLQQPLAIKGADGKNFHVIKSTSGIKKELRSFLHHFLPSSLSLFFFFFKQNFLTDKNVVQYGVWRNLKRYYAIVIKYLAYCHPLIFNKCKSNLS